MSDAKRIACVAGCCVLAAVTPFVAGLAAALLAIAPIALAIWLLVHSGWSTSTRVVASVLVVGSTLALMIAFLLVATQASGD
jgi:hypothetical protein